jgi:hypothetical protein
MNVEKFEDLEHYLDNWINFHGDGHGPYDFVGATCLLSAILRNLDKNALESDFDNLDEYFDKNERQTLNRIFRKLPQE